LAVAVLVRQRLESVLQELVGQVLYFPQLHLLEAVEALANQERLLVMLERLEGLVGAVVQIALQEQPQGLVEQEIRLQHHLLKAMQEVLPAILVEPDLGLEVVAVVALQGHLVPVQEMVVLVHRHLSLERL
jgi:hypothetical protein